MTRLKDKEPRQYIVPLRREWLKVPRWRRSKRAISTLKQFLFRHTKAKNIKVNRWVNEEIWKHGGKNPPSKIKIKVTKEKDTITAELAELPPRAKRIDAKIKAVAEKLKKEELPKKEKEKVGAEKKIDKLKSKVAIKAKSKQRVAKVEKKKSKKELLKELEEAKEVEEQKKKSKITKAQEIQMKK